MLWIAPTERQLHAVLATTKLEPWRISSLPEKHGCDILVPTKQGICGFQRKTLPDLVASHQDGRLYYELGQLNASATVSYPYLLVESDFATTTDGYYVEANLSVSVLHSIIAKFHVHGIGYLPTQSPRGTITCCISVSRYLASGNAWVVHRPKQLSNAWGRVTSESYSLFLLQSFPGIGPKVAKAIYDHFGTVPLAWSVTAAELAQVPGIGRRRAERLIDALSGPVAETGT